MKISGIVFDKDGTLLNTQPFWSCIVKYAAKEILRQFDYSQDLLDELLIAAGIQPNGDIIPEGLVVAGTNEDIANAWERVLNAHRLCVPKTFCATGRTLLGVSYTHGQVSGPNGLHEVLQYLKNRELKLAVATSDDLVQTEYCLQQLNIRDLFAPVMTADQVKHSKPDGEMMRMISQSWNIPAAEIIMVGDSANDMLFAKNSGALGVYLSARETSLPDGAIGRIETLEELPRFLSELETQICPV